MDVSVHPIESLHDEAKTVDSERRVPAGVPKFVVGASASTDPLDQTIGPKLPSKSTCRQRNWKAWTDPEVLDGSKAPDELALNQEDPSQLHEVERSPTPPTSSEPTAKLIPAEGPR